MWDCKFPIKTFLIANMTFFIQDRFVCKCKNKKNYCNEYCKSFFIKSSNDFIFSRKNAGRFTLLAASSAVRHQPNHLFPFPPTSIKTAHFSSSRCNISILFQRERFVFAISAGTYNVRTERFFICAESLIPAVLGNALCWRY